jgi:hypothetical protein
MGVCRQRHTPAILPPGIPATLCIRGPVWTDAENLPFYWDSIPGPFNL